MTKKSTPARKPRTFSVADSNSDDARSDQAGNNPSKAKRERTTKPRKPKAIDTPIEIILQPDSAVDEAYQELEKLTPPPLSVPNPRGFGWGKLALGAFSALIAIGIGLSIDQLIRDLFARNDWLGWAAIAITAIAVFALLAVIVREVWGLSRLRSIEHLRQRGEAAKSEPGMNNARKVVRDVVAMFENRPETAHGRALLDEHDDAVMDGADLVRLIERDLLAPLDKNARSMVMQSAKRVSIVTAVSPRALVDIGFVLFENMRLIRRIAEHYGGKPGAISSLRLAREVLTHLAATGAIAVGDGLLQQVIGQGLAARLSARLGEGVVNGLLTARIGIAAIDVCRPLKFDAEKRPGITDFVSELTRTGKSEQ